jgi:2-dehydropantoate 2-reductase
MHFLIFGAGTIGCYVGGCLAQSGAAVTLVGRERTIEAILQRGLAISDLDNFKAHVDAGQMALATKLERTMFTPDTVVLLCVKGGATRSATKEIAAVCPAGTTVISLQNGVENVSRISEEAPALAAVAAMVPFNVVMPQAGMVHRGTTGSIHMARTPVSEQIQPLLQAAGLPLELVSDMRSVQWGKLLLNLNNPVNALSNLPLRAELMQRDYRRVLAALQTEALAVLKAAGIAPAKVTSVSPKVLLHLLRLPDWLFTRLAARMLRMDENARSSMWDDVQQGRVTEVDDLCGAVLRLGALHGVATPVNAAMGTLMARHRAGQAISGSDLRRATGI